MKTSIQILIDEATPPLQQQAPAISREEKVARLLKKITYAIDCIEYDYCKPQAIAFLQKLHHDLSIQKQMRNDTQMLIEKCYKAISDYGILPISPDDEKGNE